MISKKKRPIHINSEFIQYVQKSLTDNEKVSLRLPVWGRLFIDRCLPFLVFYRRPKRAQDAGTYRLVTAQASYLIAQDDPESNEELFHLIYGLSKFLKKTFGAFLAVEVWTSRKKKSMEGKDHKDVKPTCRIFYQKQDKDILWNSIETLKKQLSKISHYKYKMNVDICEKDNFSPPRMASLSEKAIDKVNFFYIGIEIDPCYRNGQTGSVYPLVFQKMRKAVSRALSESFYKFSITQTTHAPVHYHSLGRRAIVSKVWEVDRELAVIADAFDFLLQITPVNQTFIWEEFKKSNFKKLSKFYYRPLPVDPTQLKQDLFRIPIGKIDDPSLSDLFLKKQFELERKINMLFEIDSVRFLYGSMQLFGDVEPNLKIAATKILTQLKKGRPRGKGTGIKLKKNAQDLLELMKNELKWYQKRERRFKPTVEIRDDIISGVMVSKGDVLIGKQSFFMESRLEGLIQHEIGTHVLTYYNGLHQPFQQLHTGLVGYDELQEGLAVLSEYFVDGLTKNRLRILAARVLAAESMICGASFIETFQLLQDEYSFSERAAFNMTFRLYRGGGYTKDMIYLRGFLMILDYLKQGGDIGTLFIGKFGFKDLPIIRELLYRKVLKKAKFLPRYMGDHRYDRKIDLLHQGLTIDDLIEEVVA